MIARMASFAGAVALLLMAVPVGVAQESQTSSGSAQKAEAGAGTTDGTTNGKSGPQSSSGKGPPPLPGPRLCDDYQGQVKTQCLAVVLGPAPPQAAKASGSGNQPSGNNAGNGGG